MSALFPQGEAVFSPDGLHRYWLTRELYTPTAGAALRVCVFCMLNPSTATAELDDPTIRRCKGFATAWCCHRLIIVNAYGFRATKPADMFKALRDGQDIVGPDNDLHIMRAVAMAREFPSARPIAGGTFDLGASIPLVVGAWGKPNFSRRRWEPIARVGWVPNTPTFETPMAMHQARVRRLRELLGASAHYLALNEDGSPAHPLYQPADLVPTHWPLEVAA